MKTVLLLICTAFLLASCVKNNPDPAWIEVTDWQLVDNPNSQYPTGVLTENITDAWVYIDNKLVGVFEVPFKIPVLVDGDREVTIYPTVLNNGISATKKIYPFMEPFSANVTLVKNEVVTLNPITWYKDQTQFWIEDFEDASYDIVDGGASAAALIRTNDAADIDVAINEGFFGRISLNDSQNSYSGSTVANNNGSLVMDLPRGRECYLEIDYHTTNALVTGVLGIGSSGVIDNPNVQINAQSDSEVRWKKIYIDVREIVSGSPNAEYFEFSFKAALDDGDSSGEINIDNVKAVYF